MTFELVRSLVAKCAYIDLEIEESIILSAQTTMELISLLQSNGNLTQQEAINYLVSCI